MTNKEILSGLPIADKVTTLMEAPAVEWNNFQAGLSSEDKGECIRHLDAVIQRASMLRGYLDARYGHGCGDQGHNDGVKQANRLVSKVRKVIGYSIPKQDVRF